MSIFAKIRLRLALIVGKSLVLLLRIFGKHGTAYPGLIIEKYFPDFLKYSTKLVEKIIVITGTNGKTSTQTILSKILKKENLKSQTSVVVNSRGSNLKRGLISEFLKSINIFSNFNSVIFDYGVLEIEEATLPKIIQELKPNVVIVTNFFRDQLDAYGEIERTKKHILTALTLSPPTTLISNGDDPQCLDLVNKFKAEILDQKIKTEIKLVRIPKASEFIDYENALKIESTEENTINQKLLKASSNTKLQFIDMPQWDLNKKTLGIEIVYCNYKLNLKLPGFYSYYALAYSLVAIAEPPLSLRFNSNFASTINHLAPAFGRGEQFELKNTNLQLFLVKNPVGFDLTLDLLSYLEQSFDLVILINDQIADGRDVSWLWDSRIEKIYNMNIENIVVGGERAEDMKLRLKYAGIDPGIITLNKNIDSLIYELKADQTKAIATYTAMNQFRDKLI